MVVTRTISLATRAGMDVINVTEAVSDAVSDAEIKSGAVTVFVPGATGGLSTIEYEPGLVCDLREFFDRVIPEHIPYRHEERWHDDNGHSHIRATLLGPSITIPFNNNRLLLGTWQQIIFVDFDTPARRRELILQIMGE